MTLWQELLKILEEAESLFGPRDRSYQLLEPEIYDGSRAQGIFVQKKQIKIYLTKMCADDFRCASYELSHEAIHLLSPVFYGQATVLEEGLATYFSHSYVNQLYGLNLENAADPKYDAAMHAVSELLTDNEFLIKELRVRQPVISKITARMMVEEAGVDTSLARFLGSDFETYGQPTLGWTEKLKHDADFVFSCVLAGLGIDRSKL